MTRGKKTDTDGARLPEVGGDVHRGKSRKGAGFPAPFHFSLSAQRVRRRISRLREAVEHLTFPDHAEPLPGYPLDGGRIVLQRVGPGLESGNLVSQPSQLLLLGLDLDASPSELQGKNSIELWAATFSLLSDVLLWSSGP